jgi:SAM-dependent methyltransferase
MKLEKSLIQQMSSAVHLGTFPDSGVGPGDGNEWYAFLQQRPPLTTDLLDIILKRDNVFFELINSVRTSKGRILDAGCGTGARMITYSVATGAHVTLLDRDPRVLELARNNARSVDAKNVECKVGNIFHLYQDYKPRQFEVITHHGVLEHYDQKTIRVLIDIQLSASHFVIFSVPVLSEFNRNKYAGDGINRHLWTTQQWVEDILGNYHLEQYQSVHVDKDELLAVIVSRSRQSALRRNR